MNSVFIFIKDGNYRCLSLEDAQVLFDKFENEGWKHTATINPETWMEFFLNGDETKRFEAIESISE